MRESIAETGGVSQYGIAYDGVGERFERGPPEPGMGRSTESPVLPRLALLASTEVAGLPQLLELRCLLLDPSISLVQVADSLLDVVGRGVEAGEQIGALLRGDVRLGGIALADSTSKDFVEGFQHGPASNE